ncbi:MAG: CopG family transcriptional regulator [Candidatus Raymondbacteria bacterium RifOxyA12_full_50_37]|uniref:CopG family transcriptional regulator n=1 Tax=Candidatus Raymondbacteria bacterium RIFOXYD12_FULL_49_13 TaxID=1817890 RepID=A0A1F7F112_UNCRA|nr:MAG: CopG family transcriptional regulator [Candidatus Raymondbacteria bacterium RifOxyA12_full_50_37]OGJ86878.1 MAG: CopG family transcriptional regulator [Candidatus Raymondbacteria bacterium RIFOXYA2_FULL_49_16]OGJ94784.1 MAG: CopG family transcriptional regulator [Candidatus Raymondbacteria bacterium RifOxyB12_full_50_8]OGJ98033.1 MAG: CopG family transcriptional regulator [Candidatus Raymondbacteria bacterium RifOxyC12_full_50_8]OGK00227.1 MAG: CopG family transcriptional regulator [Can
MKKKTVYTDGPIGDYEIIDDFLPPPELLIRRQENVRVTINLNKSSVGYFKEIAKTSHTQYQKIIRSLLDYYATRQALAHK